LIWTVKSTLALLLLWRFCPARNAYS